MINELVIGHSEARIVAQSILDAAGSKHNPIAVAIVDNRGDVVYLTRQDGASAVDVRNSERKAYTAAFIGRDTALWRLQIAHDGRTVADFRESLKPSGIVRLSVLRKEQRIDMRVQLNGGRNSSGRLVIS